MICFGVYRLDRTQGLWRDRDEVKLTPKSLSLLSVLVERAGQVVPKEELFRLVLAETAVSDAALTSCIQELRRALADNAHSPQFIETVHRRGYRFIAPLTAGGPAAVAVGPPPDVPEPPPLLVGREAELRRLHDWLALARAGQRQVAFITGGPGSGKTALVEALRTQLGGSALVAPASVSSEVRVGRGLRRSSKPGPARPRPTGAWRPCVRGPRPGWPTCLSSGPPRPNRPPGILPERMLREMARPWNGDGRHALVLVLGPHWADLDPRPGVRLARRREPARLLVLATYRPVDVI